MRDMVTRDAVRFMTRLEACDGVTLRYDASVPKRHPD
jgi:hypothetical protein